MPSFASHSDGAMHQTRDSLPRGLFRTGSLCRPQVTSARHFANRHTVRISCSHTSRERVHPRVPHAAVHDDDTPDRNQGTAPINQESRHVATYHFCCCCDDVGL